MAQDIHLHLARLWEYSDSIRGQNNVIEYVLARGEQVKSSELGSTTMFVLARPPLGVFGMVHWEAVWAWMPHFQDSVVHRIRCGYLPLGKMETNTGLCEVFVDLVPEAYRQDILNFAGDQFQKVYEVWAEKVSSSEAREKLN
jgi:hypothetical protein